MDNLYFEFRQNNSGGIGKKTVDEIIDLCNQAGVDLKP